MATLRSMTIENFKAIGEPVKIEFKPITLLFGPNSAGKSTIIQALCYAREIFVNRNLNPHHIVVHGEQIDLGGFRAMVHNHDFSLPINFSLELDLKGDELPDYIRNDEVSDQVETYAGGYLACLKGVRQVSVSVSICWDNTISSPLAAWYRVDLNGAFFCEIEDIDSLLPLRDILRAGEIPIDATNQEVLKKRCALHMAWLNFTHPVFDSGETGASINLLNKLAGQLLDNHQKWHWTGNPNDERKGGCLISGMETALPDWENPPDYWGDLKDSESSEFVAPECYRLREGFDELIKRAVAGPGKLVRDRLQDLRYLGPLRAVPPRILEQGRAVQETAGSSGSSTWEELFSADEPTLGAINDWMNAPERLNTGYRIDVKRYWECDSKRLAELELGHVSDRSEIISELRKTGERTRLSLRNADMELSFQDVGTGISQVIPVIIAALVSRNQIVAIEQPELHIHPALQVKLGDLFISRITEGGSLFLLETHSEHLILRMLRRIRETSENKLPSGAPSLRPDQVNVIYIEPDDGTVRVLPLRIDETGEFIDRWPQGFFEERANELF